MYTYLFFNIFIVYKKNFYFCYHLLYFKNFSEAYVSGIVKPNNKNELLDTDLLFKNLDGNLSQTKCLIPPKV